MPVRTLRPGGGGALRALVRLEQPGRPPAVLRAAAESLLIPPTGPAYARAARLARAALAGSLRAALVGALRAPPHRMRLADAAERPGTCDTGTARAALPPPAALRTPPPPAALRAPPPPAALPDALRAPARLEEEAGAPTGRTGGGGAASKR